ncbi:hypothetical protein V5799_012310 [Amblyomma americanum]|uniref:FAD dependent oxidoreductase domain-containing protein n=1 Tax=Amblyomma americanum TaxID=6943 RepID=A0AAQ4EED5_AMBAM
MFVFYVKNKEGGTFPVIHLKMSLPAIAKVVICGAGVIGNSIAYNLVKRGWTDIVVLEKGRIGCGATWRSSGLVGQLQPTIDGIIARSSAKLYQELHDAGHDIGTFSFLAIT